MDTLYQAGIILITCAVVMVPLCIAGAIIECIMENKGRVKK